MHGIAIHGGAGALRRDLMTPQIERLFIDALGKSLKAGNDVLANGGSCVTAVEQAIIVMEDYPLFNAGRGSNFTNEGKIEMDASLMDGRDLSAGAVACVSGVKNPISLCRSIRDDGRQVLLIGEGARSFAVKHGLELRDSEYFFTQHRWDAMERMRNKKETALSEDIVPDSSILASVLDRKCGTVGAVAVDLDGNLAAGTSTGGTTAKAFGRAGDSSLIGAGTYANNKTCAVSGTGHGEYFIRATVAHDISSLMEYAGMSLEEAANKVVHENLKQLGGRGGVIAIDAKGNVSMPFNTKGMYRGYMGSGESPVVKIYKD